MYQQLYERFDSILSPKQCVFRKGYSTQHYLMVILEKLKESKDRGGGGGGGGDFEALFTNLSKAIDCTDDHNLLITRYLGMGWQLYHII